MTVSTIRSKRQFRSANVHRAFRFSPARGNMAKAKLDFRTRTQGTINQIGQKFPIGPGSSKSLPKIKYGRYGKSAPSKAYLTSLELDAMKAEREMELAGFKGYTIGIKLKDGTVDEIPLIAKDWHTAFNVARMRMKDYNPDQIDEITIIDPSLSEIAHAIGSGAQRFAAGIKHGVEKIPGYARRGLGFAKQAYRRAEAATLEAARETGRVAALPTEIQEQYEIGKARRPTITSEAASELSAAQELIAKRRPATATMTPSEIERRRRSSRRPFQSRVFGSDGTTSSVTSEESKILGKAKEQLRKAKWALKGALG